MQREQTDFLLRTCGGGRGMRVCSEETERAFDNEKGASSMKKYLNISIIYAIAAMAGGVFYREFTKYAGYTGVTALGKVHVHLFLLGMVVFLVVALYAAHYDLRKSKAFRGFLWTYNIGVPLTAVMLAVRGVSQVLGVTLSDAVSASVSGVAGIGHILTGVGILLLLFSLKALTENGEGKA